MARVPSKAGVLALSFSLACAGNNGLAITPPMSWRSWNNYDWHINADLFVAIAGALVDSSRAIIGRPTGTSLRDIGYATVGMDEGWAACGPFPAGNWAYHRSNPDGSISPVVNETLFPSMAGLVEQIHTRGLDAGWYLNDCMSYCFELGDTCGDECNAGDVAALIEFGFDSVKFDGCSHQVRAPFLYTSAGYDISAFSTPRCSTTCRSGRRY